MDNQYLNYNQLVEDYDRIEKAIMYIENNYIRQPHLAEIAASVGLSEYHFQRLFTRWAGVSPKQFIKYLTKEYAKDLLQHSPSLLEVTYQAGLSSPGRLHDLFITCEAVTPGEYKNKGLGLKIKYGVHPSPFGHCLIASTERGICSLKFLEGEEINRLVKELKSEWPEAEIEEDSTATEPYVNQIFKLAPTSLNSPLHVYLRGTNFQLKVWEALMQVPAGRLVSYNDLAQAALVPRASRAVGNAVANNPVAYIIPCHRVIRKAGEFGNYRWGTARKKAILGWELAHSTIDARA